MDEIAKAIFEDDNFMVLSTVCGDGAPWGTPVHFAYDETYVYWLSLPESIHSQNIEHDSRLFITVFDSRQSGDTPEERRALYIATRAELLSDNDELAAREVYNDRYPDDNFRAVSQWRVYRAAIGTIDERKTEEQRIYYRGA